MARAVIRPMAKPITTGLIGLMLLSTAACSNLNTTEQRMLSGGAIGAGAGAIIGATTALPILAGVGIGAAAGAAGGYIYDQVKGHPASN
jgi:osmotically inducible lipoprotein OsmB